MHAKQISRRRFLDSSKKTALALGATLLANAESVRGQPASERVVLAMVGVRGRGSHLAEGFMERGDCHIAYVCDVDSTLFASRAGRIEQVQGKRPECVQDFRKALDDSSVDAIISATPDHWHALSTVWGCQAGKDVYVEKPASHSAWEGRKMVEAARKYDRVVQIGTQNRSAPYNMAAKEYLDAGKLGDIHLCRIYNQKSQGNRGESADSDPPEGLDWDMFNGPAPEHRYNPAFHRYWNHLWRYSGGDIANDAIHQIDLARWLLGVGHPSTAYSVGGRFASSGVAETPDTQVAVWEYPELVVSFDLTLYTPYMLKSDPVLRESDIFPHWPQNATRIEIYGTKGVMLVGRHGGGWQVFGRPKDRKPEMVEQQYGRFPDPEHKEDFIQAVRNRNRPSADVEHGHLSALLVHYANISHRLDGRKLHIDPKTDGILDDPDATALLKRSYRAPWTIPEEV